MKVIRLVISFVIFSILAFYANTAYASTLFSDYFSSIDYTKWSYAGTSGWTITGGKYGILLSPGLSDTFPSDGYWNNSWKNISYEVDLEGKQGYDKNIILRYVDSRNFYDIHHSSDNRIYFEKIVDGRGGFVVPDSVYYPLVNSTDLESVIYHVKVIVCNNNYKVWINDNIVFDYIDSLPLLSYGKVGIRAGTGASPTTEVWFDNVVVTDLGNNECPTPTPTTVPTLVPTDTPVPTAAPSSTPSPTASPTATPTLSPTPTLTPTLIPTTTPLPTATPTLLPTPVKEEITVLVPGMGASVNFKQMFLGINDPGGWQIIPGVGIYDNIPAAFSGDSNFYLFYYDWRIPTAEVAKELDLFVNSKLKTANGKANLIGHSLGGLLVRACVDLTADMCRSGKVITLGAPHLGAVDAYPMMAGGEVWRKGVQKLAVEMLIKYFQQPGETDKQTINRILPSGKDLLPNFEYLKKNNQIFPWSGLGLQNPLLGKLSPLNNSRTDFYLLFGDGLQSNRWINLGDPSWLDKRLGNWPDGKPVKTEYSNDGDKSILRLSAAPDGGAAENRFALDHGQMASDTKIVNRILAILGRPQITVLPYRSETDKYFSFIIKSLANGQLSTPLPVQISLPGVSNGLIDRNGLAIVPNPANQEYRLELRGISSGKYQLIVGAIAADQSEWFDYFGDIKVGKTETMVFRFDDSHLTDNPLVSENGHAYEVSAGVLINELKNRINKLSLTKQQKFWLMTELEYLGRSTKLPNIAIRIIDQIRDSSTSYRLADTDLDFILDRTGKLYTIEVDIAYQQGRHGWKKLDRSILALATKAKESTIKKTDVYREAYVYSQASLILNDASAYYTNRQYFPSQVAATVSLQMFGEIK